MKDEGEESEGGGKRKREEREAAEGQVLVNGGCWGLGFLHLLRFCAGFCEHLVITPGVPKARVCSYYL